MLFASNRITTLEKRRNLICGGFERQRIVYSDGTLFYEGWVADLGDDLEVDGRCGPAIFPHDRQRYRLDSDIAFSHPKYRQKRAAAVASVSFRRATEADRENLLDLRFQNYFDGHYNVISAYQAFSQRIDDTHITFVAEGEGLLMGHLYVVLDSRKSEAYIDDLFVAEAYRGCGLGSALLQHGEATAKDIGGCSTVSLTTIGEDDFVENNRRFYESRGYMTIDASSEVIDGWSRVSMRKGLGRR